MFNEIVSMHELDNHHNKNEFNDLKFTNSQIQIW